MMYPQNGELLHSRMMVHTESVWERLIKLLSHAESIVLCTHEHSDGDGLGSQVAMYEVLRQLGRSVTIINPTDVPHNYNFLTPLDDVIVFDSLDSSHIQLIERADLFILLDANQLSRTRKIGHHVAEARKLSGLKIACIDHHLDQQEFADEMVCVSDAAATGELVFELIKALESHYQTPLINKTAAMGLYTSIMTDTGSFRFPKTSSRVHRITAELLEMGVEPMKIYEHVYSTMTPQALKLIGTAVNNVKMFAENRAAYILITRSMFEETGAQNSDTERLTDYMMAITTVRAAMMFVEQENGTTKLSLRSKGNVHVNELAKKFGGGGHKNAAGCVVPFPPEKAIALAIEHVQSLLKF